VRGDRAFLLDILDAITGIEKYQTTRHDFDADERTQAWMVSRLQTIGEASRHLSDAFRSRHPEIPWRLVIGMRHHLVHAYFEVDPDVVWEAISVRIPELREQVRAALATDTTVQSEE